MAWHKRLIVGDLKYFAFGWLGGCYVSSHVDICKVSGRSMLPTLSESENEYVLVSKTGYPSRILEAGAVYTYRSPSDPEKCIIKRLIGRDGDTFDEKFTRRGYNERYTVPEGHIWVEGDNPPFSEDSRCYGGFPAGMVIGKALGVVWPFSRARMLEVWPTDKVKSRHSVNIDKHEWLDEEGEDMDHIAEQEHRAALQHETLEEEADHIPLFPPASDTERYLEEDQKGEVGGCHTEEYTEHKCEEFEQNRRIEVETELFTQPVGMVCEVEGKEAETV